ncbi:FkbM family methyltransferase [Xylophilus ampelinus]|uniref:FkbM family methyltransferase n=1 Tax=Xylophilus ampelinus TaxID=54067 RepID=A0A318SR33_9BURK|nr:FkbM family methyltransferase [Xylophilus ampelinus]MCS4511205.1 FkbM family methyltransferase [Xylophilus ampelinus]PYE75040.1 FkbM family methyltransferase [Xylophilus ampelinus]
MSLGLSEHDLGDAATQKAREKLVEVVELCRNDRYAFFPDAAIGMVTGPTPLRVVVFSTRGPDCGHHVEQISAAARLKGGHIEALVHDTSDTENRGHPALAAYKQITLEAFFSNTAAFAGCLIVDRTSTWYPAVRYKTRLKQAGFNVLRQEQFLNAPGLETSGGFYREHADVMLDRFEEFLALERLWGDAHSRQTYYYALASFISMNYQYFAFHCGDYAQRYFAPDIDLKLGPDTVYADCGSHDGKEILIFSDRVQHRFKAVHAFEPDRRNFVLLSDTVNRHIAQHGALPIYCHELGVFDRDGYLQAEGHGTQVVITEKAETAGSGLHVCKLDNMLDDLGHLRLEIEGAELAALHGARQLILEHRPTMTVSVYHKATDFLELPRFIEETGLDYQLSLRHQSLEPGVLCMYAV